MFRPRAPLLVPLILLAVAGCHRGKGDEGKGKGGGTPVVVVGAVAAVPFADRIQAVGTAYARESTTLTSTVTERIAKLHFEDGEFVRKGQVIAELVRGQETAGLAEASARQVEAQQKLDRLLALQKQGFATNASVEEQVAVRDAARAQAGSAQAQIGDRVIRAPFSGVLGLRRISLGATATAGTEIATISDVSSIKLDFTLPETFLSSMRAGQPIEAKAAAYPDETFRGTVAGIDPAIDPTTRAVTVRAILPNGDRRLRPGMLLTVTVLSNPRTVIAVPETAVIGERDRNFVFKVDSEMTALKSPVVTGGRQGELVEIKSGLKTGDRIITEGVVKVRDGGKVKTAKPAKSEG